MNRAYYSHYVGDVFGAPLPIEGLMAFFLESTFIGLFFLGWERLSKRQHLVVTFLMALGSNLSALWILIANGWMQNPVGSEFSYETMRSVTSLRITSSTTWRRSGRTSASSCAQQRPQVHVPVSGTTTLCSG